MGSGTGRCAGFWWSRTPCARRFAPVTGCCRFDGGNPRRGQIRVFPDPTLSTRWLVKRVGEVRGRGRGATFQACSDNPGAPGVVDSRQFGWVPAAGSYRVVWTVRGG